MKRRFECVDEGGRFLVVEYNTDNREVNVIHKLEIADDTTIEEVLDMLQWDVVKEEQFDIPKTVTRIH